VLVDNRGRCFVTGFVTFDEPFPALVSAFRPFPYLEEERNYRFIFGGACGWKATSHLVFGKGRGGQLYELFIDPFFVAPKQVRTAPCREASPGDSHDLAGACFFGRDGFGVNNPSASAASRCHDIWSTTDGHDRKSADEGAHMPRQSTPPSSTRVRRGLRALTHRSPPLALVAFRAQPAHALPWPTPSVGPKLLDVPLAVNLPRPSRPAPAGADPRGPEPLC